MIKDRLGQPIFGTNTHHLDCVIKTMKASQTAEIAFQFDANLGQGTYSVAIALHTSSTHITKNYEWRDLALVFNVVNLDKPDFVGCAWLPPQVISTLSKQMPSE